MIIGIDIGGTSVKIGMIDENGNILHKWEIPTNKKNNGDGILEEIWASIEEKIRSLRMDKQKIRGIGVGAPGFINVKDGLIYEAVNIGWKNYPLASRLKSLSDLPVYAGNDANVAVLGENWKGAGNQAKNVIAITLGTGVGGGIIANGTILNGENGTAGEIGHMMIDPNGSPCNCGRRGCLETIVSATGIVRQAMENIEMQPHSALSERHIQKGPITSKDVFELAEAGDEPSKEIVDNTCHILGLSIANLATSINPSKILIGGGVSMAGDQLLRGIRAAFDSFVLQRIRDVCEIKLARLGNDAGIIGAAFLVKQHMDHISF